MSAIAMPTPSLRCLTDSRYLSSHIDATFCTLPRQKDMKYTNLMMALMMSFNVNAQKNCNTNYTSFIPLNELGSGYFRGFQGGLYANGSNSPQFQYLQDLKDISASIQPLDDNGNPSSNGKIVMIGVGASNPRTEFQAFQNILDTFGNKNPKLIAVNTCIGGQGVQKMNAISDNYWKTADKTMDSMGLYNLQVQVAWIETEHTASADSAFPSGPRSLVNDMKQLLITLKSKYPNLKICYLSARAYAGWVDNSNGRGLEFPRDYYNGWAMKWLIDSASQSAAGYEYKGQNANIPMPAYSTYNWTNGEQVRQDGFSLDCDLDIGGDGLHLTSAGEMKIGLEIFKFFSQNNISSTWFLKNKPLSINSQKLNNVQLFPNPGNGTITFSGFDESARIEVYDAQMKLIQETTLENGSNIQLNTENQGLYYIRITSGLLTSTLKYVLVN